MTINWLACIAGMIVLIVLFFLVRDLLTGSPETVLSGRYALVLLVFNSEDKIESLIRDLRKMRSRHPALELVVVDKGSDDLTVKILERLWRGKQDFQWTVMPGEHDKLEFVLSERLNFFSLKRESV